MQKMHNAISDKPIAIYDLDTAISVGYRVKPSQGELLFRRWATARLKEHLIKGYTLNQQRFDNNTKELELALTLIDKASKNPRIRGDESKGLAEIISRYTHTFLWLERYDE